jgi:hypothetical protein
MGHNSSFKSQRHHQRGLHYGLAHNACEIVADNRYDGWLSATRSGKRIEACSNDVLPAGEHWFFVPCLGEQFLTLSQWLKVRLRLFQHADLGCCTDRNIVNGIQPDILPQNEPHRYPVVTCFQG